MKKFFAIAFALTALTGLTAACGGVDEDGTVDLLVEQGLSEETARCVVDTAVDDIPDDVLTGDEEASEEQTARLFEIFDECGATEELLNAG